ncbi:hypothetical protein MHYP_G00184900 [Metynnis hypsauchen]
MDTAVATQNTRGQSVYLAPSSVGMPRSRLFHGPPYLSLALLPPPLLLPLKAAFGQTLGLRGRHKDTSVPQPWPGALGELSELRSPLGGLEPHSDLGQDRRRGGRSRRRAHGLRAQYSLWLKLGIDSRSSTACVYIRNLRNGMSFLYVKAYDRHRLPSQNWCMNSSVAEACKTRGQGVIYDALAHTYTAGYAWGGAPSCECNKAIAEL